MITILGRVKIQDLPTFIGIFATRGAAMRQQHGSLEAQLFTVCDTPLLFLSEVRCRIYLHVMFDNIFYSGAIMQYSSEWKICFIKDPLSGKARIIYIMLIWNSVTIK